MPLSVFERTEFLKTSGWSGASMAPVGEDWSQRKFFRVGKADKTAILIHTVPDNDPRATPGHKLWDFLNIGRYLASIEISVPDVYAHDISKGLMLVEDFGTEDFAKLIAEGGPRARDIYLLACRSLSHLYQRTEFVAIDLPDYYKGHIHIGRRRVVDWYVPSVLGRCNPDGLVDAYLSVWKEIERGMPRVFRRFLHGDFHPGNLMYLPDRVGFRQVGMLDFQGGMMGPAPYDLLNLLEDARRIVPEDIRAYCLSQFLDQIKGEERESFAAWYPVLSAQFHFRVIGQAIKLAIRDQKTRLAALIPVLQQHITKDLENPLLKPMKDWFEEVGVDFSAQERIDISRVAPLIRDDAF